MRTSVAPVCAVAATVLLCAVPVTRAHAQTPPSLDTWVDACDVGERDLSRLVQSDAAMVPPEFIDLNLDGTYRLRRQPLDHVPEYGTEYSLCPDSRFFGQPRPDGFPAGRSAFLVGPDLVLTANHFFPPDVVPIHYFVFGLHQRVDGSGACVPPDLDRIPAENVYRAVEIVKHGGDALDFLLLRLDRPVKGRPFVRVRRSGAGAVGDRVTVVGHPEMLPTKVDLAGTYEGLWNGLQPLVNGVHTLVGSSGSMIYNRDQQLLESVVRGYSCARFEASGSCYALASNCSSGPFALGHSAQAFSADVPPFELVVSSLADVVHVASVGGRVSNPETTYTITSPASATAPIAYHVQLPAPVRGLREPRIDLHLGGPSDGSLDPGKVMGAKTKVWIDGVPCGRYVRSFRVQDVTHGYTDTLKHVFEIGLSEFHVEPTTGFDVVDLAPPYAATATYVLSNPRPTPVTVEVAAREDWITLNGEAAASPGIPPAIRVTLEGAGEPGDQAAVIVGIGGFAGRLPADTRHHGNIAFMNVSGACEDLGNVSRSVSFLPGQGAFSSEDKPTKVPDGDLRGVVSTIEVPEEFCVSDVDVTIQTTGFYASHLTVDLTSPEETQVRLWAHDGGDMSDIRRSFDDATTPAPTGQALSMFNGGSGGGAWALHVVDDVPKGENQLVSWCLTFRSSGMSTCGAARVALEGLPAERCALISTGDGTSRPPNVLREE